MFHSCNRSNDDTCNHNENNIVHPTLLIEDDEQITATKEYQDETTVFDNHSGKKQDVDCCSIVSESIPLYNLRAVDTSPSTFHGFGNYSSVIDTPVVDISYVTSISQDLLSEGQAEATLHYFISCGDRLSQMTRTYHDVNSVTQLLEEKEKDLELSARIGLELLQRNRVLDDKVTQLESNIKSNDELITQYKHELHLKNDLLRVYNEDYVQDDDDYEFGIGRSNSNSMEDLSHQGPLRIHGRRSETHPRTLQQRHATSILEQKIKLLQSENLDLRHHADKLVVEAAEEESKEERLVADTSAHIKDINSQLDDLSRECSLKSDENRKQQEEITKLLSQLCDAQSKNKALTCERSELAECLSAYRAAQDEIGAELVEVRERYSEVVDMLHESQKELRDMKRSKMLKNVMMNSTTTHTDKSQTHSVIDNNYHTIQLSDQPNDDLPFQNNGIMYQSGHSSASIGSMDGGASHTISRDVSPLRSSMLNISCNSSGGGANILFGTHQPTRTKNASLCSTTSHSDTDVDTENSTFDFEDSRQFDFLIGGLGDGGDEDDLVVGGNLSSIQDELCQIQDCLSGEISKVLKIDTPQESTDEVSRADTARCLEDDLSKHMGQLEIPMVFDHGTTQSGNLDGNVPAFDYQAMLNAPLGTTPDMFRQRQPSLGLSCSGPGGHEMSMQPVNGGMLDSGIQVFGGVSSWLSKIDINGNHDMLLNGFDADGDEADDDDVCCGGDIIDDENLLGENPVSAFDENKGMGDLLSEKRMIGDFDDTDDQQLQSEIRHTLTHVMLKEEVERRRSNRKGVDHRMPYSYSSDFISSDGYDSSPHTESSSEWFAELATNPNFLDNDGYKTTSTKVIDREFSKEENTVSVNVGSVVSVPLTISQKCSWLAKRAMDGGEEAPCQSDHSRVRLVKPIEGSNTLTRWQQLSSHRNHLGNLLPGSSSDSLISAGCLGMSSNQAFPSSHNHSGGGILLRSRLLNNNSVTANLATKDDLGRQTAFRHLEKNLSKASSDLVNSYSSLGPAFRERRGLTRKRSTPLSSSSVSTIVDEEEEGAGSISSVLSNTSSRARQQFCSGAVYSSGRGRRGIHREYGINPGYLTPKVYSLTPSVISTPAHVKKSFSPTGTPLNSPMLSLSRSESPESRQRSTSRSSGKKREEVKVVVTNGPDVLLTTVIQPPTASSASVGVASPDQSIDDTGDTSSTSMMSSFFASLRSALYGETRKAEKDSRKQQNNLKFNNSNTKLTGRPTFGLLERVEELGGVEAIMSNAPSPTPFTAVQQGVVSEDKHKTFYGPNRHLLNLDLTFNNNNLLLDGDYMNLANPSTSAEKSSLIRACGRGPGRNHLASQSMSPSTSAVSSNAYNDDPDATGFIGNFASMFFGRKGGLC